MRRAVFLVCAVLLGQTPDSLRERIERSPLQAEPRKAALEAFAAKDYERVASILEKESAAAEVAALAGAVDFVAGHMDEAANAFRRSDLLAPLGDRDRFTWAMALVKLDDPGGARAQLNRLHAAHPGSALYIYWLARIDYDQRLYTEAVEKLRVVIRLDPESPRAYDNLGLALDMQGEADDAEQAFQKAVDLNRKQPQPSAWPPHNLGALLLRLQRFGEAETALRESLRYDPDFAVAHYHLGRVLDAEGRDAGAIQEYRAATAHEPVVLEALYSLGLIYRRLNRTAEAEAVLAEYKRRKAQPPSGRPH